jgi:glyoxylase-like metal-dependent hydrolase (beta-lactamase superfamily II)
MPRAAIFAGASFEAHPMVHQVFQLVFPDSTLLIDSGFGPAGFETGGRGGSLTEGAIERVRSAIESARTVVITHEHGDHIGGIAEHPEPDALVGSVALSAAQLGSTEWLDGAGFPQSLREQLRPLRDEHYHAVAPGVVLIAAPGHAPGAQIVYVGLANGRELLFLGDVVWHMDAIRNLHYRPRLITDLFLGEDRRAVLHQIRRLHELMREQPRLRFVVSHDEEQRQELLAEGWLQDGLAP